MKTTFLKIAVAMFLSIIAGVSMADDSIARSEDLGAAKEMVQSIQQYVVGYCKGLKLPSDHETMSCVVKGLDMAVATINEKRAAFKAEAKAQ